MRLLALTGLLFVALLTAVIATERSLNSVRAISFKNQLQNNTAAVLDEGLRQDLFELANTNQRASYWDLTQLLGGDSQSRQASVENSLALLPVNSFGWYQLAVEIHRQKGPAESIINALVMSIYAGPYQPRLLVLRIGLALDYFNYLDQDTKSLVANQIKLAGRHHSLTKQLEKFASRSESIRLKLDVLANSL